MASGASSLGAQASPSSTIITSPDQAASTTSPTQPSSSSSLPSPAFPALPPAHQPVAGPSTSNAAGPSSRPPGAPPPSSSTTSHISPHLPTPSTERQISEARAAVVASLGNMLDSELQSRGAILHSNATALGKQETQLAKATDALRRENDKLSKVAEDAARKVKLLGNVQNWAEVLERDFLVLEETVRLANEGGHGSDCGSSCCSCSTYLGSDSGGEEDDDDRKRDAAEGKEEDRGMERDGEREGSGAGDDLERDKRMAGGLDFMGREFDNDQGGSDDVLKKLDKGKGIATVGEVNQGHHDDMMDMDGYGSHTAFSDTSRSLAEGESVNGTEEGGSRTKESETTSLSTTGGG